MKIQTVRGPIRPSEVKKVLVHEHTLVHYQKKSAINPVYFSLIRKKVPDIFMELKKYGCNLVVDQTIGYSRYPYLYKEFSEKTGIHIVAATGFYTDKYLPHFVRKMEECEIEEYLQQEIEKGMDGTEIKPGVIKIASGSMTLTRDEKKIFHAATKVCKKTDVPVQVHSYPGLKTITDFFLKQKIPREKVALAHVEACSWLDIKHAAEKGFYLVFTNFGREMKESKGREDIVPEDVIIAQIVYLVRKGYLRQIMISQDFAFFAMDKKLVPYFHQPYTYIFETVVVKLLERGLKIHEIEKIFTENPIRYLSV
ncbi:MAG: TatD family hydrolase [bacterium]|nr:TatD family hydrolase [bacterium]